MTELEALQNAANGSGLFIHEWISQDKRKTIKQFFAQKKHETVSPILDYEQMNIFLLGWNKSFKHLKIKEI